MTKSASGELFQADVCIEKMIWMPGQAANPSDDFKEFLDDVSEDDTDMMELFPWLKEAFEEDESPDSMLLAEMFLEHDMKGFLVEVARPVPKNFRGSSYSFSWGHTQLRWFYVETLDELVSKAITWSNEMFEAAREREKSVQAGAAQ